MCGEASGFDPGLGRCSEFPVCGRVSRVGSLKGWCELRGMAALPFRAPGKERAWPYLTKSEGKCQVRRDVSQKNPLLFPSANRLEGGRCYRQRTVGVAQWRDSTRGARNHRPATRLEAHLRVNLQDLHDLHSPAHHTDACEVSAGCHENLSAKTVFPQSFRILSDQLVDLTVI